MAEDSYPIDCPSCGRHTAYMKTDRIDDMREGQNIMVLWCEYEQKVVG